VSSERPSRLKKVLSLGFFVVALSAFLAVFLLLRVSMVTDYMYHAFIKDPPRTPPAGNAIVAPADGTVIYIRRVEQGVIPEVVKRGVSIPLEHHLKTEPAPPLSDGYLIGIYMNADSVHVNRVPIGGVIAERIIFNGPHMDMTEAETTIILTQLIPGWPTVKKLLGWPPYDIEDEADFILKSARETVVIDDTRGARVAVVRIADYTVGKILTWVRKGQSVSTGDKLGMITYGSQTDVFFEETPGVELRVHVGQFVYGGETVLATY